MMLKKYSYIIMSVIALSLFWACSDDDNPTIFSNDCIKRTTGPNVIGQDLEFSYAMVLPPSAGKIVSAQVEATIAGANGTYLANKSLYTNGSGENVGVPIGEPSVTNGMKTEVVFTKDTCAATLRYYYIIPEEARGKQVSFTFSSTASNGEKATYSMGPYTISKVDMTLDLEAVTDDRCFFSIEDMAFYTATEAATRPDKIDLVYLYRKLSTVKYEHAMVAPANTEYMLNMTMPSGVNRNTPIIKEYGLRDKHLARLQYGIYVDDLDFEKITFTNKPNYAIDVKKEGAVWVETQDGKYRAFIYFNELTATKATMSVKRYTMK